MVFHRHRINKLHKATHGLPTRAIRSRNPGLSLHSNRPMYNSLRLLFFRDRSMCLHSHNSPGAINNPSSLRNPGTSHSNRMQCPDRSMCSGRGVMQHLRKISAGQMLRWNHGRQVIFTHLPGRRLLAVIRLTAAGNTGLRRLPIIMEMFGSSRRIRRGSGILIMPRIVMAAPSIVAARVIST